MELIHAFALAYLVSLPTPTTLAHRLPQPTRLPITRSRGFRHAWSTTRWSDDSPSAASHFADAYRVTSPGATRELDESSWGHVLVFGTVPSANTLVRWVDENAFASIVQARPDPTFGRPVRHGVAPIDYGPVLLLMPFGFRLTADTLPSELRAVAPGPPWLYPAFAFVPV
jgi:hypothetical protein